MSDFPVEVRHPKTGGVTTAASRGSLKVLEAHGWKRKPARRPPAPDPEPDPAPESSDDN